MHLTYLVDIIAAAGQRFFALPCLDDTVGLITKNDIILITHRLVDTCFLLLLRL